jgi:L-cysteine:1D-myo-inositol 2-amino-2-deoxy-alpha-D-glucopyranoside ligase
MRLYNSLTDTLEAFHPIGPTVTVYVCGITPYDTTHLGHAFTYTVFDVLIRYLEAQGQTVRYVQNVTDIDDDILRKSREVGEDWWSLGNRWTRHFIEDMIALNVRPPDQYPRATDVIPDIIAAVQDLLAAGVAYESGGSVYYRVAANPDFGRISCLAPAAMLAVANERGNIPDDPHKEDPLDFVLWQAHKPGEPSWPSPWGPGRPGWHIECSTMARRFLGESIDIHGGGGDLLFPHHACEIAQIEPLTGRPFVRFWLHVAMVYHAGAKMSKSLGNLIMVRDLLRTWSADAVRLYLAGHHYRRSWAHDEGELALAQMAAQRLKAAVTVAGGLVEPAAAWRERWQEAIRRFDEAMADDLDTPRALAALDELAVAVLNAAGQGVDVAAVQQELRGRCRLFGLRLDADEPEERVRRGWESHRQRFL